MSPFPAERAWQLARPSPHGAWGVAARRDLAEAAPPLPLATRGRCSDSFDLFYALYSHNTRSSEQLQQFAKALTDLRADLDNAAASSSSSDSAPPLRLSDRVNGLALSKVSGAGSNHGAGTAPPRPSGPPSALPLRCCSRHRRAVPQTVAVTDKAAALRREGKQVISLSVGEPDFTPADEVMAAAHAALDAKHVKYTGTRHASLELSL